MAAGLAVALLQAGATVIGSLIFAGFHGFSLFFSWILVNFETWKIPFQA